MVHRETPEASGITVAPVISEPDELASVWWMTPEEIVPFQSSKLDKRRFAECTIIVCLGYRYLIHSFHVKILA